MRPRRIDVLVAAAAALWGFASSSACRVMPAPAATSRPAAASSAAVAAEAVAGGTPAPVSAKDPVKETLLAMLGELAKPPFGTGAALAYTAGETGDVANGETRHGVVTLTVGTVSKPGGPVSASTPFSVQSVSKLLTAARVISLAHAGRLSLDDTVQEHLPKVTLSDEDGTNHSGLISLRHLLTHRAGLPHHPQDLDPTKHGTSWSDPKLYEKMTSDWTLHLAVTPGTYRYSNLGYGLLGAVIERVEKCTFAECLATYLPEVGMKSATFDPTALEDGASGVVKKDGGDEVWPPKGYMSRYANPFGGLWTSMPDLARFGRTLIDASKDPAHPLHLMVEPLTEGRGHGLGPVHRLRFGAQSLEHDGSGPGFLAWLIVVPKHDIVFAIATNGGGESRPESQRFRQLVEAMLEQLTPDSSVSGG